MQDALVLAVTAAALGFGWFLMGRMDRFLESGCAVRNPQLSSGEGFLRLGVCSPTAADGVASVLERYSRLHPELSARMFCGSAEELLQGLSDGKFDVIFLPENAEIPVRMPYHSRLVALRCTPAVMKYDGLPIEPIADGQILQKALWGGEAASAFAVCFLNYLEDSFAAPAQE